MFFCIFRCYVSHRIPVSYPHPHNSNDTLKPSSSQGPTNYVSGTFSQLFEIKAYPGSILITKSPSLTEEGLVGGSISLECEAEIAPDVSTGKDASCRLQYQW